MLNAALAYNSHRHMPTPKTPPEQKLVADVESYGWHVINVFEDDVGPGFSYTIGLFHSFGHPEVLVMGLPPETAHPILNGVGEAVRAGNQYATGATSEDFLEGYACTFRVIPTAQYRFYLGWARWFYDGADFPALQLVYPDRDGRWPWRDGVQPAFAERQPVIADQGDPPWADIEPPAG